jgi:nucleoid DNA-binding protein
MDKRKLAELMIEVGGMTQTEADHGIQGISLALETWIEAMARNIPRGTKAICTLTGLGRIEIGYQRDRPLSAWRTRWGIPQTPKYLTVTFVPNEQITRIIAKENRSIRLAYLPTIRAARLKNRHDYDQLRQRHATNQMQAES